MTSSVPFFVSQSILYLCTTSLCMYICGIHLLCPTRMPGKMCTYMDIAGGL